MIMIIVDLQVGRVAVLVERASDLAVDRLLTDQIRERDSGEPLIERLRPLGNVSIGDAIVLVGMSGKHDRCAR